MFGVGKAERAERSGLPRFFFGYFLCSNDKESNNKTLFKLFLSGQQCPVTLNVKFSPRAG
jgi:hypothetical protein